MKTRQEEEGRWVWSSDQGFRGGDQRCEGEDRRVIIIGVGV